MDIPTAVTGLAALAQNHRLEAFRLLVRAGDDGLPAGAIARALEIPHNTMSSHLAALSNAGLVRSRREGRSIIYSTDFDTTRGLLEYLLEDCCQGAADICGPAVESVGCCVAETV